MAWCSIKKNVRIFKHYSARVEEGGKIHPTQKPVRLYEWLIQKYANTNDKILDTHLGSGSSRIAAYKMGFDFYGFELDEEYYNKSNERFEKQKGTLDQFREFNNATKIIPETEQVKLF